MITIVYSRMPHGEGLQLPAYASEDASGMDLLAAVPAGEEIVLAPGSRALIATALVIELPKGFEAQIRPRSGLALTDGVTVLNSPGTIDARRNWRHSHQFWRQALCRSARCANSAARRLLCGTHRSDCERAAHFERPWLKWIRFHRTLIAGG